jgi:hypothetical protein
LQNANERLKIRNSAFKITGPGGDDRHNGIGMIQTGINEIENIAFED